MTPLAPQRRYNLVMTTTGQQYADTGHEFLARARTYLAEDLLQASEKGWGAAAQMVKAAAEARGWRHRSHRDLHVAVNRLVEETGDRELNNAFGLANALHTNSYEGWLPRETVESHLAEVATLVEKLDALET